jgi:hypothetical protein
MYSMVIIDGYKVYKKFGKFMNTLIFAVERSIVHTTLGIIAVLIISYFFGKTLLQRVPNDWKRCGLYALVGALFIVFDYAFLNEDFANEFSKLPFWLLLILYASSFIWTYILVIPFVLFSAYRRKQKAIS